jgi:hypothetical protein
MGYSGKIDTTHYSIIDIGFDPTKCYFSIDCPKKGQVHCYKNCVRYWGINYMLANCGIKNPNKWIKTINPQRCDYEAYKQLASIRENIINLVIDPTNEFNLVIKSRKTGNGKSSWAIKLLLRYFQDHVIRAYASDILEEDLKGLINKRDNLIVENKIDTLEYKSLLEDIESINDRFQKFAAYRIDYISQRRYGFFVYAQDYLNTMKFRTNNDADKLERIVLSTDLLVLDDIGISDMTKTEHNILLSLVDYRARNNLSTIITYNLFNDEPEDLFGVRLADRLNEFQTIEFVGDSRRNYAG